MFAVQTRATARWGPPLALAVALLGCHPNRSGETVACTAGESIWGGCSAACSIGSCWGNPALLVCDGDVSLESCNDDNAIGANDDAVEPCASTCPVVRTICPASGHVTVNVLPGRGDFACDWGITSRPLLDGDQPPLDGSEPDGDAAGIEDGAVDGAVDDGAVDDAAIDDAAIVEDAR